MSKQIAQWNSGATRESNPGSRARIPSALTTKPLSRINTGLYLIDVIECIMLQMWMNARRTGISVPARPRVRMSSDSICVTARMASTATEKHATVRYVTLFNADLLFCLLSLSAP